MKQIIMIVHKEFYDATEKRIVIFWNQGTPTPFTKISLKSGQNKKGQKIF